MRSALEPDRQSLALPILLALVLHGCMAGAILGAATLQRDRRPIIEPSQVMEVSMVVLPKARTRMPEKASRAPVTSGQKDAVTRPTEPPPVKTSDLTIARPDAPAETQGAPDRSADRAALMREMLIKELAEDTPEGQVDRQATDPNSTSDEAIDAGGQGLATDPELARYAEKVKKLFMAEFRPLPTIAAANPDIHVVVQVAFDLESGRITAWEVSKPSGNASFDAAAERAVQAVGSIPTPPEKYRDQFKGGLTIKFEPT